MPPRGTNSKAEGGRAKKAENLRRKQQETEILEEAKEASSWVDKDPKTNKRSARREEQENKHKASLARKDENRQIAEAEDKNMEGSTNGKHRVKKIANPSNKSKPLPNPAPNSTAKAGQGKGAKGDSTAEVDGGDEGLVESFAASGLDNALDLLDVVNAKQDKATVGQQAARIDSHPERRFKAALKEYAEKNMEQLKKDHPGMRRQQYMDMLYVKFKKAPENPFNQETVAYNATQEEKVKTLDTKKKAIEDSMRTKV